MNVRTLVYRNEIDGIETPEAVIRLAAMSLSDVLRAEDAGRAATATG